MPALKQGRFDPTKITTRLVAIGKHLRNLNIGSKAIVRRKNDERIVIDAGLFELL